MSTLKNIIKGLYYSEMAKPIRQVHYMISYQKGTKNYAENINKIKKSKDKMRVVFVLEYSEIWNSSKTVYEAINRMQNTEVWIYTLPKYPNIKDNPAFEFARKKNRNVIDGYDKINKKWIDLQQLHPDYVFYTRPYAKEYPEQLRPAVVSRYTRICYIPYGYEFVKGYHLEIEYNMNFFPYCYMTFCDGDSSYEYCKKLARNETLRKIYNIGYPRFDVVNRLKTSENAQGKEKFTILWTPRWSVESLANDGTSFFEFINPFLNFFEMPRNKNLFLVIRPHPLMFENFLNLGVVSKIDVANLRHRIDLMKNVSFDDCENYLISGHNADLIISDFSSMLIEFLLLDKPIIYCGKSDNFDVVGKKMDEGFYHLNKSHDICKMIVDYLNNGDTIKQKREQIIGELSTRNEEEIGNIIANILRMDFEER